jgi:hypothetical protein
MDTSPKILMCGFSDEEYVKLESFFTEISAPQRGIVREDQGNLTVNDILFSDNRSEERYLPDQQVVLFFNVKAEMIKKIMTEAKKKDLPRPIYAMVTRENIGWKFSALVDHLKKEHEFIQKRLKDKKEETH